MGATKQDIVDFKFIYSEYLRIQENLSQGIFIDEFNKEYDGKFGSIGMIIDVPENVYIRDRTKSYPQLKLSYKAYDKFLEISRRQINSNRLANHITLGELSTFLREEFYLLILNNKVVDENRSYSKLIDKAIKKSFKKMDAEIFYFPILALGLEGDLNIGNAKICTKNSIFDRANILHEKYIIDNAISFCESNKYAYEHFLKVIVTKRSNFLREKVAKNIADFIVGILQLFSEHYGISHDFVSLSFNPQPKYDGFYFKEIDGGKFDYNFSSRGRILWSNIFWGKFQEDFKSEIGNVLSTLISLALDPSSDRVIADRLIDSIYTFNSALNDKDEAFCIVKLTAAMERLVSLTSEKNSGITSRNFRNRVAALVAVYYGEFDKWIDVSQEMYDLRSDIVHGNLSIYRTSESINRNVYSQLVAKAILSGCIGFFNCGLTTPDKDKNLKKIYRGLEFHFGINDLDEL
ncbi:hypothetical protein [Rahnella selenatireducens]|uniref:hypothetical protein n=1 Tax=Rahnella selenatireducens TaxID=3389797 RepID=UPI00396809F8